MLAALVEFEKATVEGVRAHAGSVEVEIGKEVEIRRPSDPADRLAYEMRMQEIRSDLRRLTAEERFIVYSQAADPLVIDAIESAPPTISRVGKNGPKGVRLQPFIDPESRAATALEPQRSEVPVVFWWLSLAGGLLLFVYFVWRKDPIGVLGQSTGVAVYARNLRLIAKERIHS